MSKQAKRYMGAKINNTDGTEAISVDGNGDLVIDAASLPVADASNSGILKAGIQDGVYDTTYFGVYKANVAGVANKQTITSQGFLGVKNLVSCAVMFDYKNNNGTNMATRARIVIKDTTSQAVLEDATVSYYSVPSSFNTSMMRTISVIVPPPTGTTYTIDIYEENSGGGAYTATNATISGSISKVVI